MEGEIEVRTLRGLRKITGSGNELISIVPVSENVFRIVVVDENGKSEIFVNSETFSSTISDLMKKMAEKY